MLSPEEAMEETQSISTREPLKWLILRIAIFLLYALALSVVSFWDLPIPRRTVLLLAYLGTGIVGFLAGFQPMSEHQKLRASSYHIFVLTVLALTVRPTAKLLGILDLPVDERYPNMWTADYLVRSLLFPAIMALTYPIGEALFRRKYPDRAYVPLPPEDREELDEPIPREIPVRVLVIILLYLPTLLSPWLWPGQTMIIGMVTSAVVFGGLSFLVGYHWHQSEVVTRRFMIAIACIGPAAGFIGYMNSGNVTASLLFATKVAVVTILPALIGRLVALARPVIP